MDDGARYLFTMFTTIGMACGSISLLNRFVCVGNSNDENGNSKVLLKYMLKKETNR